MAIPRPLVWITALGVLVRIAYWVIHPPVWKTNAAFNVFELGLLSYVADFAGYKPSRMPFFDAFSAFSYAVFSPLFGVKALPLFDLLLSVVAIPVFYLAVRSLFDDRVAVPASLLFALYPKLVTLTSRGMPEAASISFVALSLYALARARSSDSLRWYAAAGTFAMLSFAMFVAAVAFGVFAAAFVYATDVRERSSRPAERSSRTMTTFGSFLPTKRLLTFSVVPGVVGVLYLLLGPLTSTLDDVSGKNLSIFTEPAAYSFLEKVFWYLSYTFFDFWWHTRGFDRERGIRPTIESLQGLFGDLFVVYFGGWSIITLTLTVLMAVGLASLLRRRRPFDLFVALWIFGYAGAYTYKNLGWIGGFQTRHVSAAFPALCIVFGVGAARATRWIRERDGQFQVRTLVPGVGEGPVADRVGGLDRATRATLLTSVLIVLGLSVLLVNGAVQGVIENQKSEEAIAEPVRAVDEIVDDESVGVVTRRDFHNVALYSENAIRPTILTDSVERRDEIRARHRDTSQVRLVRDPALRSSNVTYLYLRVEHEYVDRIPYTVEMDESRVSLLLAEHETVYHRHVENGPFRTTSLDLYLLRIDRTGS